MGVQAANDRAMAGVLACASRLVAVRPAREVVPGMRPELVLHAGPPASWDELSPLLRTALAGAAELEGLSVDELVLGAASRLRHQGLGPRRRVVHGAGRDARRRRRARRGPGLRRLAARRVRWARRLGAPRRAGALACTRRGRGAYARDLREHARNRA